MPPSLGFRPWSTAEGPRSTRLRSFCSLEQLAASAKIRQFVPARPGAAGSLLGGAEPSGANTMIKTGGSQISGAWTLAGDDAQRLISVLSRNYRTEYECDANGWVSAETRTDGDGNVVSVVRCTRNAMGLELTMELESPARDDYRYVYIYDEQGNRLASLFMDLEGDEAGVATGCTTYAYDVYSNPLTEEYSPDCTEVVTSDKEWSRDCFES
jgi:YD repeat-containing protein